MSPPIEDIKHKYEAHLLAMDGVVSVGIGRDDKGRPAIVVGVRDASVAEHTALPQALEGVPVVTRVLGTPRAQ